MDYEFSRTELLLGREAMERLRNASVMVFGVGGVGSHCIDALARCGIGRLVIIDHDTVSLTNINRQSVADHMTVGRYKTEVIREQIARICPEIRVETYERFILEENLSDLLEKKPDYIVDAIDTVTAKLAIVQEAQRLGIPLISSMGTGNKLHPELFEIADIFETSVCPLCRVMRRELKARGISGLRVLYSKEKPIESPRQAGEEKTAERSGQTAAKSLSGNSSQDANGEQRRGRPVPGSISFVPPAAGLLIAGEVVRTIAGVE